MSNDNKEFNKGLLAFIEASPTPFHATKNMADCLLDKNFQRLDESSQWQLEVGGRYFVTRNDSSIVAFIYGELPLDEQGIRMIGAHTDSPCLKVKPSPEVTKHGYNQLGVEVYGGVLQSTWFDRDLSLAGRVTYRRSDNKLHSRLVNFERAIATIPSLAIHLDREANTAKSINPQTHLPPILLMDGDDSRWNFRDYLKQHLEGLDCDCSVVLDYELSFYDVQSPAVIGADQEFINSARLDNLLSCYVGLQALLECDGQQSALLVCTDHEEVGSASACGAQGPFLEDVLTRLQPVVESRLRCVSRSLMVSADNAHAIHPNFSDKHDQNHGPKINGGPVIKINSNQRYATNSETSALFRHWCDQVEVPVQSFVTRTDMGCGSTIGPITASEIGVSTIDVGVPTFAMHSIREMAGTEDARSLQKVLSYYVNCSLDIEKSASQ